VNLFAADSTVMLSTHLPTIYPLRCASLFSMTLR
jgi:hypothetical protein